MSPGEVIALVVGVFAIFAGVYRFTRLVLDTHYKARRSDEALTRIAQWFPDEHPNGEESLPAQVTRLHRCMDALGIRLEKVERAVGVKRES